MLPSPPPSLRNCFVVWEEVAFISSPKFLTSTRARLHQDKLSWSHRKTKTMGALPHQLYQELVFHIAIFSRHFAATQSASNTPHNDRRTRTYDLLMLLCNLVGRGKFWFLLLWFLLLCVCLWVSVFPDVSYTTHSSSSNCTEISFFGCLSVSRGVFARISHFGHMLWIHEMNHLHGRQNFCQSHHTWNCHHPDKACCTDRPPRHVCRNRPRHTSTGARIADLRTRTLEKSTPQYTSWVRCTFYPRTHRVVGFGCQQHQ